MGFILAHASSLIFAYNLPVMFGLGMLPNMLQLLLIILTQMESPSYLSTHNKLEEARSAVEKFYERTLNDEATREAL